MEEEEHYNSSSRSALPAPVPILSSGNGMKRHVPLFRHRNTHVKISNPSIKYFASLPAENPLYESEQGSPYSNFSASRLLNHLSEVYDFYDDKNNIGYGLEPKHKRSFLQLASDVAQEFLETFEVPYRWWCAVFMCAFQDACYELQLVPDGQRCWLMENWIEFWEAHNEADYTPDQMMHFCLQWEWLRE